MRRKIDNKIENDILSTLLDSSSLINTNPELFNLNKLHFTQKIALIRCNSKKYSFLLEQHACTVTQKLQILIDSSLVKFRLNIEFSEDELTKLTDDQYVQLTSFDFTKYIRKDRFLKLSSKLQGNIFIDNPEWYVNEISTTKFPKITSATLGYLSNENPTFVDTYIKDYSQLSTNAYFWIKMIVFHSKYRKIFLENTNSVINKSDVRSVFREYPPLIKQLNEDNINKLKLSSKEILLLIEQVVKNNKAVFKNWKFDDKLKEALRLDITAELLTGESKLSPRLTSSLRFTTITEEEEDEDKII